MVSFYSVTYLGQVLGYMYMQQQFWIKRPPSLESFHVSASFPSFQRSLKTNIKILLLTYKYLREKTTKKCQITPFSLQSLSKTLEHLSKDTIFGIQYTSQFLNLKSYKTETFQVIFKHSFVFEQQSNFGGSSDLCNYKGGVLRLLFQGHFSAL